jgi:DNA transformation protein
VAVSGELIEFLKEQMAGFGPVSVRRMFGGAGLFRDGLMFALVVGDVLYLKADEASRGTFEAEGLEAFAYATSKGRNTIMSFMRAPEICLDDPDEMTRWCRLAFDAALRAKAPKPSKKAKPAPNP